MIFFQLLVIQLILPQCAAAFSTKSTQFWDATKLMQPFSSKEALFQFSARSRIDCARHCSLNESCSAFVFWGGGFLGDSCQGFSKIVFSGKTEEAAATGWRSYVRKYSEGESRCRTSGVQMLVFPELGLTKEIVCEDDWIVILRRQKSTFSFYRGWDEYVKGFGILSDVFWFGLEALHKITSLRKYELVVDLTDWDDVRLNATYTNFSLASGADKYRLRLSFVEGSANDSLTDQNGMLFTTIDADNDILATRNCAAKLKGAWWHSKCTSANLFGIYKNSSENADKTGITWKSWHGTQYSLKFAQMKIRPSPV